MNEKLKRSIVRWIGLILIVAPFIWNAWFPFEDGYWLMDFLITIAGIFLIAATIAEPFEIIGCIMIAIGWCSVVLYILNAHKALTFSGLLIVSGGIVPDLPRIISRFKKRKSFPRKVATACGPSHAITSPDLPIVTKALPVTAPCPGTVLRWTVADGQLVSKGDEILVMDVMKMETPINAPCAGIVSLKVAATDHVHTGDMMALILINSCVAAPCCGLSTKQDAQPEQEKTRNNSKTASKVIGKVPLLVDGNNVVRQSQRYGWRVLKTLLDWLNANNVDHFLYFDASIRYVMKEEMDETGRAFIDAQLQDEGRVTICPARDEADKFILSRANKEGNHIISDDGYRQWEAQYPWINAMNETGNRRVHKFSVEGDVLSVPDLDIREKIMES